MTALISCPGRDAARSGARESVRAAVHELANVYLSPSLRPPLSCRVLSPEGALLEALLKWDGATCLAIADPNWERKLQCPRSSRSFSSEGLACELDTLFI
jgi:hypothetical protein